MNTTSTYTLVWLASATILDTAVFGAAVTIGISTSTALAIAFLAGALLALLFGAALSMRLAREQEARLMHMDWGREP